MKCLDSKNIKKKNLNFKEPKSIYQKIGLSKFWHETKKKVETVDNLKLKIHPKFEISCNK